jgi:hypothetical protein
LARAVDLFAAQVLVKRISADALADALGARQARVLALDRMELELRHWLLAQAILA